MFMTWQKLVGGRLESRPSFSNTMVWNNFPLGYIEDEVRERIIQAGEKILEERASVQPATLAELYRPGMIPRGLLLAYEALDVLVDRLFFSVYGTYDRAQREVALLERYRDMSR